MKTGDLVRVKEAPGYNTLMQNLVGHVGIIMHHCKTFRLAGRWEVMIYGKCYTLWQSDLELVDESR
tara:strand:+ start:277 stop:474 length:198 start_codon:yes stop_codon:yes gene_type:complete